jgi:hypothetical protein
MGKSLSALFNLLQLDPDHLKNSVHLDPAAWKLAQKKKFASID